MASGPNTFSVELCEYARRHSVREPAHAAELRRRTELLSQGTWHVPPEQAQFISLLAQIAGVQRFIEIGTFTGYTTLWMALTLPADAEIITCDVTDEFARVGLPIWEAAGVRDRIDLQVRPAAELLDELAAEGLRETFDMAFIDADKEAYVDYYHACLELVRPGGLILVDNVLWRGRVTNPADHRRSTEAIRTLNATIAADKSVTPTIVPFGDGLTVVRKH